MASIPALNVKGPEFETVELETLGVPEDLVPVVQEEVSPPVATSEAVPCQPSQVTAALCQPIKSRRFFCILYFSSKLKSYKINIYLYKFKCYVQ